MAAADGDPRLLRHPIFDAHRRRQLRERPLELFLFLAEGHEFPLHVVRKLLLGNLRRSRSAPGIGSGAGWGRGASLGERCPRPGHEFVDLLLLLREAISSDGKRRLLFGAGDVVLVPLRDPGQRLHRLRALEHTGKRVVIGLGDRIELVVVAAGTAE